MDEPPQVLELTQSVWGRRFTTASSTRPSAHAVHEHAAMMLVMEGRASVQQRGRYELCAGDIMLVPAGQTHRSLRSTAVLALGVAFRASCYAPSELAPLLDPFERARSGASPVVSLPTSRQEHVAQLFGELRSESASLRPHGELVQKALLALILAEITRASKPGASVLPGSSVVADALRFIERHCLRPISLVDVARAVGRSPAYVTTALKRATGKSAGGWIIESRLAEARNRLLHTDEMVEEIAERVGYSDATHFIRLFRRAHGVTPSAWRHGQRSSRPAGANSHIKS